MQKKNDKKVKKGKEEEDDYWQFWNSVNLNVLEHNRVLLYTLKGR